MTVGIFAEAVLRKIIADPHGFNQRERKAIWATRSQLDRWLLTVDLAFRRHNHVLFHDELSINTLGDRFDRYAQIRTALERELKPLIEDRNKFAHGQWKHFLKSGKDDEFSREAPSPPTYTAIVAQYKATNAIAAMIHVLAVSDPAFQRDYDNHFRSFNDSVRRMQTDYYSDFAARLRARRGGRS
ncbi:hypothetical protein [Curtobacterium sp. 1544]|uniref:hypothetical protein n=1 Tax=Curtobacterium sp. 1544 TaxID=3156417 RepID=UPI003393CAA9